MQRLVAKINQIILLDIFILSFTNFISQFILFNTHFMQIYTSFSSPLFDLIFILLVSTVKELKLLKHAKTDAKLFLMLLIKNVSLQNLHTDILANLT